MEETVFLFCSRRQFAAWKSENCGNCRKGSAVRPGCDLSAALRDALFLEGVVPLNVAERLGYFDMDEDPAFPPGAWTCREFQGRDLPFSTPGAANETDRAGGLRCLSPRPVADN